ncbi:MAG: DNA polymerase III subunit alpha, partial [Clostridia bacterium]
MILKYLNYFLNGKTNGVFQLESSGFKQMMRDLKPDCLEDIIVMLSLYRPGPMDQIPRYIKNKNNLDNIEYTHIALEPILKVTNGCMVYQEQVMQIFRDLAGYSFGRADLVRRAMGKKKLDVMNKEREIFVSGAFKNNIDNISANKIFDEMAEFAKYAFNKSHAAAYAVISYQTAYLKTYYKSEFMAAIMNSFLGDITKTSEYIEECKQMGIKVLKPDINSSDVLFTVVDNDIRFALKSIKNMSILSIESIIDNREKNGKYLSFVNFLERIVGDTLNKKAVECLIKVGAFDLLEKNLTRQDLLENYEDIIDSISKKNKTNYEGQFSFFEDNKDISIVINKSNKILTDKEILDMEKEMTGVYISGHPLDEYSDYILNNSSITTKDLEYDNDTVNYDNKTV